MAKVLIMTEGKCEYTFMNLLLNRGLLIFENEDLLYEQIFNIRQIKTDTEVRRLSIF